MKSLKIFLFAACFFIGISSGQVKYQLIDLGTLGGEHSVAYSINDSGQVVGQSENSDSEPHAFLWQEGNMIELEDLGMNHSSATDINNSGQIVGSSIDINDEFKPVLWENGNITELFVPGNSGIAREINDFGSIAGWYDTEYNTVRAAVWDNLSPSSLDSFPGGSQSGAYAINNIGQAAGSAQKLIQSQLYTRPCLWLGSTPMDLGTFGGNEGRAEDINNSGWIVGSAKNSSNRNRAFLWNGSLIDLGTLRGVTNVDAAAYGINDSGQIVGTCNGAAFIWQDGVITNLNDLIDSTSGWDLTIAHSINNSGQIVGRGNNGTDNRAFLLVPDNTVPWLNPDGGVFSQGSNWLGGNAPDNEQVALFDSSYLQTENRSPSFTITFDNIENTKAFDIANANLLFDFQEHSYEVDYFKVGGDVEFPHESLLKIINGKLGATINNSSIGIGIDGNKGQVIVDSNAFLEISGSRFSVGGSDDCGDTPCGIMSIQNGGVVYSNGCNVGFFSEATVYILGAGSEWNDEHLVSIGFEGSGLLLIHEKGLFRGKHVSLDNGVISLSDTSAIGIDDTLYTGINNSSNSEITVSGGSQFINFGKSYIGYSSGSSSSINVKDQNSLFSFADTLLVGVYGSAGISVTNGGNIFSTTTAIPGGVNGIGSALIDGENSLWRINETLWIGQPGVGFVRLTNNGTLHASKVQLGPLGSIDHSGGNLYVGGNPNLAPAEFLSDTTGKSFIDTLIISSGGEISADSIIFGEGGFLGGEGSFDFDVTNSGGINPGDSIGTPGLFIINANYNQLPEGTLFIELEGETPGNNFDQLIVNDNAMIAGTLDVSVLGSYSPQVGQTYEILTAQNITGIFDKIITHRGLEIDVTYNQTNIIVTVESPVSVDNEKYNVPTEFSLHQNFPNPFNPMTVIQYSVGSKEFVTLKVYDILGREVAALVDEEKPTGTYKVQFNASSLSSGIYFYELRAGNFSSVQKMILMK